MNGFGRIIVVVLCIVSMGWGVPAFAPGDLDRDGGFDLQDVILSVRCISQCDESTGSVFGRDFTNLVRAIRAAAGLDASIIQESSSNLSAGQFTVIDMPSVYPLMAPACLSEPVQNIFNAFSSVNSEPSNPPPESMGMISFIREVLV